jgi:hypothetical protein
LQEFAELRLTARPFHVDHQLPGDLHGVSADLREFKEVDEVLATIRCQRHPHSQRTLKTVILCPLLT